MMLTRKPFFCIDINVISVGLRVKKDFKMKFQFYTHVDIEVHVNTISVRWMCEIRTIKLVLLTTRDHYIPYFFKVQ